MSSYHWNSPSGTRASRNRCLSTDEECGLTRVLCWYSHALALEAACMGKPGYQFGRRKTKSIAVKVVRGQSIASKLISSISSQPRCSGLPRQLV